MQIKQRGLTLRSRTQHPYFNIETKTIDYTTSDIVIKVLYFSIDPVMKFFLAGTQTYFRIVNIGDLFNCFGLAIVIQGNSDSGYETGDYVFGNVGTCDYNVLDDLRQRECFVVDKKLVQMYGVAQFLYLINNGLAAYAGLQIMKPKQGETVVVSTASGATGLLLCQLLHKKKIKTLALTSSHKIPIVAPYSYKTVDYKDKQKLIKTLKQTKFQCYFDNVGQHLLDLILQNIQINGRIAMCGAIANYNSYSQRGIKNSFYIISKRLTLTGLTFMAMMGQIQKIFQEYKGVDLKIIQVELNQFQQIFTDLLTSGNQIIGKVVVKL